MEDATRLYIPVSDDSTSLDGLIAVFINNWSGARTKQIFVNDLDNVLTKDRPLFHIRMDGSKTESGPRQLTTLPFLMLKEGEELSQLTVAGLAAVCRHMIRYAGSEEPEVTKALGFRLSCLQAPAEVSVWTAFCEVRMPAAVEEFLTTQSSSKSRIQIPTCLAQFESHLKSPIRMHNIVKRWQQDSNAKGSAEVPDMKSIQKMAGTWIAHTFAEGPDMTLADLLLYPCVRIVVECLDSVGVKLGNYLPTVARWMETMNAICSVTKAWEMSSSPDAGLNCQFEALNLTAVEHSSVTVDVPVVSDASLYKKDPDRQCVSSLSGHDVETIVETLKAQRLWPGDPSSIDLPSEVELQLDPISVQDNGFTARIDWNELPEPAHPRQGQVPGSRLDRKIQQLDNVARAVMDCAVDGDVIVDFCSGGGHLGIVLAHLLPRCRVIMVDNKEESVRQARRRAAQLALPNMELIQSNLDYFKGRFNIGVALHACGVATDLVLHSCLSKRASFVLCPCCYGNLALDVPITYPQSRWLMKRFITQSDFSILARVADHPTDRLTGRMCMAVVDLDRIAAAAQRGYKVVLKKLQPDSCTPKHNLLIGRALHSSDKHQSELQL